MPKDLAPLSIALEFARVDQGGDPYAFRIVRQQYLLRSAGGGFESIELGWDQPLLESLKSLCLPRPDPKLLQQLGEMLRHFLQPSGWNEHEEAILAAVRAERPVIMTLRSAAAELYALPWELLTLKSTGQHIAELPGVLIRYEWPETVTSEPPAGVRPGRILFCWSAAGGPVPAAEQRAAIEKAGQAAGSSLRITETDVVSQASVALLGEVLDKAQQSGSPITVLHLLCHGASIGDNFGLALDGEQGAREVVDAGQLRRLLAPFSAMLRLVIVSACNGANSGAIANQLGSVAQALHRAGIEHVIASRYPLSVAGSVRMTEALYGKLLSESATIEEAVLAARHELVRESPDADWASLQFFAREKDGGFQPLGYLAPPSAVMPSAPIAHDVGKVGALPVEPTGAKSGIARRRSFTLAAMSLGAVLALGALGAGTWRARSLRTARPPAAQMTESLQQPSRDVAKLPATTTGTPTRQESLPPPASPSKDLTPVPEAPLNAAQTGPVPDYRGVIILGSTPLAGAQLTLLGTECRTQTDAAGVFNFKHCSDSDGLSRLSSASVLIQRASKPGRRSSCNEFIVKLRKPPAISRIDIAERCSAKAAAKKPPPQLAGEALP